MSHSLEETEKLAAAFVDWLSAHPSCNIIGFSGDLGSGKTAFTKLVAKKLGIEDHITSPTFVIRKKYPINLSSFPFSSLIHIDAYRLESAKELETIGIKDDMAETTSLTLIEWPEKVRNALPKDLPIVEFTFVDEGVRTISFPGMMAV